MESMTATPKEKALDINYVKTCDCKDNHLNCMTAKEWIKSQLGVWQFNYNGQDIRDKSVHPATFPVSLAKKVIELFSHKGELVLDPFVGSGTTLVAAQDLSRNAVGFDLHQGYKELCEERLVENGNADDCSQIAVCDDAKNINQYLREETVKLVFTSPPYANLLNRKRKNKSRRGDARKNDQYGKIEQYSQDERDLGTYPLEKYTKVMGDIF
jgi:DNA modification methylase